MRNLSPAVKQIKSEFITEGELAGILGCSTKRLQDLRSQRKFIVFYKPARNCILYHIDDVIRLIKQSRFDYGKEETVSGS